MQFRSLALFILFSLVNLSGMLRAQDVCYEKRETMFTLIGGHFELDDAIKIYEKFMDSKCNSHLFAYNFIGFAFYNHADLDQAKEYLTKGENEFLTRENSNKYEYATNQMYFALVAIVEKDFVAAIYRLNKAEKYGLATKDQELISKIYQNKGLVYQEMNHFEKSIEFYNKAISYGELEQQDKGYIYQNIAYNYLKQNELVKSTEFIAKTKEIWEDLDYDKGKYFLSFVEAKLAIKKRAYRKALQVLEKGRLLYHNENKLLLGENYLIEAQIHDCLGNEEGQILALENALIRSDDLSDKKLNEVTSEYALIQESNKTEPILVNLISRLKNKTVIQQQLDHSKSKVVDTVIASGQSMIFKQSMFLLGLGILFLVTLQQVYQIRRQKIENQSLLSSLDESNKAIEYKNEELKAKNIELEQFAYTASHDLKSPLGTISSFAQLLKEDKDSEESDTYLEYIIDSSNHMGSMISQLLNYSTLNDSIFKKDENLKSLIEETTQWISSMINSTNATIIIDDSCDQVIRCDKTIFENVIQNLIKNSIAYAKKDLPPVIVISTKISEDFIAIDFKDNGIGIEKKYQADVFKMFKRLKENTTKGTGIGLATCQKIIDLHGGHISLESTKGEGATFTVHLPV